MSAVAAVILAGGRGERLGGVIKSELRVGGRRLLDRVLAALIQCHPILVAHGRLEPQVLALPPSVDPIPDLTRGLCRTAGGRCGCDRRIEAPSPGADTPYRGRR